MFANLIGEWRRRRHLKRLMRQPVHKARRMAAEARERGKTAYVQCVIESGHETYTVVANDPAQIEAEKRAAKQEQERRLRGHGGWC